MTRIQVGIGLGSIALLLATGCSARDDSTPDPSTSGGTTVTSSQSDSSTTTATSTITPADDAYEATFEPDSCPFPLSFDVVPECGYLTVPEDRDKPNGRQIRLAVAVFPPRSGSATEPPVVYLEGGPGGEILEAIPFAYEVVVEPFNEDRFFVVFDQRGTGYSEPSLACPEIRELTFEILDDDLATDELVQLRLDALRPCRDRWAADGVDLSQYNSADSAADVADLRRALGYDEWDLYGVSYGTRLALTVMRDHPDGVRSVVLDSTYPPEVDGVASIPAGAERALSELFAACAADPTCVETFGDLEALLFGLIDELNVTPITITVTDFFTADRYPALIAGDDVLDLVFQALYSEDFLVEIPEMLDDIRAGSYLSIEFLTSVALANQEFFAIGQNFSVQCHEEVAYADPAAAISAAADFPHLASLVEGAFTQSAYAFEFCDDWGAGVGDPIEAEPVFSDIPTLVVSGQFDPITPPDFGRAVADRLTTAWFVEYPGVGHGVAALDGCPLATTLAFLADPTGTLDTSCAEEMPAAHFTVFEPDLTVELIEVQIDLAGDISTALVPQGWEDVGGGAFYRSNTGVDQTVLLVQALSGGGFADLLVDSYAVQFTSDGVLDRLEDVTIGERTWSRYSARSLGMQVEVAVYRGDATTIAVVLLADPRESDALFELVFVPALDSVELAP